MFHYPQLDSTISTVIAKDLKDLMVINSELYFRDSSGVLARALSLTEAKEEMQRIHFISSGENNLNLYRRLQRQDICHEIANDC